MYYLNMREDELINEALRLRPSGVSYYVNQQLATHFPDKAIIESDDSFFNVEKYSEEGQCTITALANRHNEVLTGRYDADVEEYTDALEGYLLKRACNAWQQITWHSITFTLLMLHWE